jgi:hypothetical protein
MNVADDRMNMIENLEGDFRLGLRFEYRADYRHIPSSTGHFGQNLVTRYRIFPPTVQA